MIVSHWATITENRILLTATFSHIHIVFMLQKKVSHCRSARWFEDFQMHEMHRNSHFYLATSQMHFTFVNDYFSLHCISIYLIATELPVREVSQSEENGQLITVQVRISSVSHSRLWGQIMLQSAWLQHWRNRLLSAELHCISFFILSQPRQASKASYAEITAASY